MICSATHVANNHRTPLRQLTPLLVPSISRQPNRPVLQLQLHMPRFRGITSITGRFLPLHTVQEPPLSSL
jgi:hypothetical protein